jgi:uncharacterized protein (TIGR02001 family)
MMRRIHGLALGLLLLQVAAHAAAPTFGGGVSLSTDHVLRGTSRSSGDAALSAELHLQWPSRWFVAAWASTSRVRPADSTSIEVAATLGYGLPLSDDWTLRGSYSHYENPGQTRADFYRYDEITVDLAFRESLLLSASYSPNTSRYGWAYGPVWHREAMAWEAAWQHPLGRRLHLHAGAGYYDLSDLFGTGYWYGSAGLTLTHGRWQLDGAWLIPQRNAHEQTYRKAADRRAVFTLSWNF